MSNQAVRCLFSCAVFAVTPQPIDVYFTLAAFVFLAWGAGVILLAGLFVYDIFWVFCTPVMVSVAKSFDAPIKLLFKRAGDTGPLPFRCQVLFDALSLPDSIVGALLAQSSGCCSRSAGCSKLRPQFTRRLHAWRTWRRAAMDFIQPYDTSYSESIGGLKAFCPNTTTRASPCSMLGLGDIVIPGIFVALLLRYDKVHGGATSYFRRCSRSTDLIVPRAGVTCYCKPYFLLIHASHDLLTGHRSMSARV